VDEACPPGSNEGLGHLKLFNRRFNCYLVGTNIGFEKSVWQGPLHTLEGPRVVLPFSGGLEVASDRFVGLIQKRVYRGAKLAKVTRNLQKRAYVFTVI